MSFFRRQLRLLSCLSLSLAFLLLSPAAADGITLTLDDSGVVIDDGSAGEKLTMLYPLLVNEAKAKAKIAEKSVSGNKATLKYEGGGQLEIELGEGLITMKPAQLPTDNKFVSTSVTFGSPYTGGKWQVGTQQDTLPAEKGPKQTLFQGSAESMIVTTALNASVAFVLPKNTFEQILDIRHWGGKGYLWQFWPLCPAGTERIVIKVGNDVSIVGKPSAKPAAAPAEQTVDAESTTGTQILKWKDGKKAVFMLAFDDSAPSQLKNVVPELIKRKIPGTFYLVTGNSLWDGTKARWIEAAQSPYIVVANHTFTHKGATSVPQLEEELSKCNDVLLKIHPDRKQPRLLGFGKPGGVPWQISKEELDAALLKNNLVDRPPFYGPPMHYKSSAEVNASVDKAIQTGGMGHLDFHGVGGDWLVTPMDWFVALLDKLEASKDVLWVTDTVSWVQYTAERKNCEIKALQNDADRVRLSCTTTLNTELYNIPLTLSTKVPAAWKGCEVTQGATKTVHAVKDGRVQYDARPGGGEISLQAGSAPAQ